MEASGRDNKDLAGEGGSDIIITIIQKLKLKHGFSMQGSSSRSESNLISETPANHHASLCSKSIWLVDPFDWEGTSYAVSGARPACSGEDPVRTGECSVRMSDSVTTVG